MTSGKGLLHPRITGMRCIRCGTLHAVADYFEGCPQCLAAGFPSSVAPSYSGFETFDPLCPERWLAYPAGPFLGEGRTPLIPLARFADEIGVASVAAKYEGANPTGSHKDRMSALIVQRACEIGARTIAVASSGNAGVSVAAYAANAGLKCVVVTTSEMSANWRRAVEMHGAELIATERLEDRWRLVERKTREGEWYAATNYLTPPVGSNPFGVDGYRAIAFELVAQCEGDPPTDIVVPTSRGDIVWGIAQGYRDLQTAGVVRHSPKVHAVEPFSRISRVVAGADYRADFPGTSTMASIGGSTVTLQAVEALKMTGGTAVAVSDSAVARDQRELGRAGLYLELSSASSLTGLRTLVSQGTVTRDARVILVATSHGYKEEATFDQPIAIRRLHDLK